MLGTVSLHSHPKHVPEKTTDLYALIFRPKS